MNPNSEQPPHPADVVIKQELRQLINECVEQHNRLLRVVRMGQEQYNAKSAAMFPEDEWTRRIRPESNRSPIF